MDFVPSAARLHLGKLAFVGNHIPRQCGIATFTADLASAIALSAPSVDTMVVAMNDPGKVHDYPERVRFQVEEDELGAYRRAAQYLNVSGVDVVSLQHEYGIFGGKSGSHVLTLLRELAMPVVTTLHTILSTPSPEQRATFDQVIRLSERVVAMSQHGADLLRDQHGARPDQIDIIPHGIPVAVPGRRGKALLGFENQRVLLTFGLLSPDKGIEYVIEALPAILKRHPQTVFVIVGATHPHVKERSGEEYRLSLVSQARRLGVDSHVVFHDRFVHESELAEFLAIADIYITPYLNPEQSTSGTLARAVAAGRAVISTPYWHARELLAEGRGLLVPTRNGMAIARAVGELLEDDAHRKAIGARAAEHARDAAWPVVAQSYLTSFERALEGEHRRVSLLPPKPLVAPADLPELNLEHLQALTDDTGLLQHATFDVPHYQEGYCVDDNARALLLLTQLDESSTAKHRILRNASARYLAFVAYAFNRETSRFRNFMSYSRQWREDVGSEDSHGRAMWALGTVAARSGEPNRQVLATELFRAALPKVKAFSSPRAWAYVLLGINEVRRAAGPDPELDALRSSLVEGLCRLFRENEAADWLWFEKSVTYSNARLCQALIVTGDAMSSADVTGVGLKALGWLASLQISEDGRFAPIGSNGFYRKGEPKAAFDQQPVEAHGMVSACLDALRVTGDARWAEHARRAFDWFLGGNHLGLPLYDASTGGCRDGLHAERRNENQGAESTVSFLLALLEMRSADASRIANIEERLV